MHRTEARNQVESVGTSLARATAVDNQATGQLDQHQGQQGPLGGCVAGGKDAATGTRRAGVVFATPVEDRRMALIEDVRILRRRGLTLRQIEEALGISRASVARWCQ